MGPDDPKYHETVKAAIINMAGVVSRMDTILVNLIKQNPTKEVLELQQNVFDRMDELMENLRDLVSDEQP